MRILAIANFIPLHDRSAGGFRFYRMLSIMAREHDVLFHPTDFEWQCGHYGEHDVDRYRRELEGTGVRVTSGKWADLYRFIRSQPVDVAFFEHYATVKRIIDQIRFWQPSARVITDTIDVAYHRLSSKAKLTGKQEDVRLAEKVKAEELSAYARSDLVIGISEVEAALLKSMNPGLRVEVIPLVFAVRSLEKQQRETARDLVYVAHFEHEANVDGILHFCTHVLPLIRQELPDVRLRIVGHSPPAEVKALGGPNVEVLGFVPDISEIYRSSDVAIAPMRFGGGLKGKIAEAMSFGLPVVTNSGCLVGFGLSPGMDVLVGDDPVAFANAVVSLLRDKALYEKISLNGWQFIKANFSEEVVAAKLNELLERRHQYRPKKLALGKRVAWNARLFMERHLLWRVRGGGIEGSG
jgi:glycosyltransferase involved in cell wall biosynthesis